MDKNLIWKSVLIVFIVALMGCSEVTPAGGDLPVLEERESFRWPAGKRLASCPGVHHRADWPPSQGCPEPAAENVKKYWFQ